MKYKLIDEGFPLANENLAIAIVLLILSIFVFYFIIKKLDVNLRGLVFIDLIWMVTLTFGIYFTIESMKGSRLKINVEYTKKEIDQNYYLLIRELNWIKRNCENEISGNYTKSEILAMDKIISQLDKMIEISNHARIPSKLDGNYYYYNSLDKILRDWKAPENSLTLFEVYNEGLKDRLIEIKNTDKELNKLNQEYIWTEKQQLLYFFYPWILCLVLGLRFSKSIYHFINFKELKSNNN